MRKYDEPFLVEAFVAGAVWREKAPTAPGHTLPLHAVREAADFWVMNEPMIVLAAQVNDESAEPEPKTAHGAQGEARKPTAAQAVPVGVAAQEWRAEWTQLVNTFAACRSGVVQEFVERLLAALEAPPELTETLQRAVDVFRAGTDEHVLEWREREGRRFVDTLTALVLRGETGPPPLDLEARIGCLGSVNLRHGVAFSYCPECGTEEGPPASRVANPSPELHIYSWRGAVPPREEPQ